jgi:hypothetical protein
MPLICSFAQDCVGYSGLLLFVVPYKIFDSFSFVENLLLFC